MTTTQPVTETPETHAALAAALTAAGGAAVAARFSHNAGEISCAMQGREFILAPELRADVDAHPGNTATVYGTWAPVGLAQSGAADVLAVADDGSVYAGSQAFGSGAAPLCTLSDADARSAIAAHLLATLPGRQPR